MFLKVICNSCPYLNLRFSIALSWLDHPLTLHNFSSINSSLPLTRSQWLDGLLPLSLNLIISLLIGPFSYSTESFVFQILSVPPYISNCCTFASQSQVSLCSASAMPHILSLKQTSASKCAGVRDLPLLWPYFMWQVFKMLYKSSVTPLTRTKETTSALRWSTLKSIYTNYTNLLEESRTLQMDACF